jgi:Fe-S-cluster containining protein
VTHPRLKVLNMPHESAWAPHQDAPRFLVPAQFSTDPCTHCGGHCCGAQVDVTTVEAVRIAATLGLPIHDVVRLMPHSPQEVRPGDNPPIVLTDGAVTLALQHNAQHKCVFLHHIGPRGRCSIHGVRPGPCRVFPYDVAYKGRRVRVGSQLLCPVKWLTNDAAEARLMADIDQWRADQARERKLVTAWKRARTPDRSFGAYITFAVKRLEKVLGLNAAALLAPPRRTFGTRLW